VEIRPAPSTSGSRNGMPESGDYVYRGTGKDIMPWAITDDDSTDYDPVAPSPRTVKRRALPKERAHGRGRCSACGYGTRSLNHRVLCGG